jgi:hypothetical protein
MIPADAHLLGRFSGLDVLIRPRHFALGTALLSAVLTVAGTVWLGLPLLTAAFAALLCAAVHWLLEIVHNLGHANFAQFTGQPMSGMLLGDKLVLARSLYPPHEPELAPGAHIIRALGGPLMSTGVGFILGFVLIVFWGTGSIWQWIVGWGFFESVVLFGPGALLAPLPFVDGGTILYWLMQRGKKRASKEN